jgi:hypothetical protein
MRGLRSAGMQGLRSAGMQGLRSPSMRGLRDPGMAGCGSLRFPSLHLPARAVITPLQGTPVIAVGLGKRWRRADSSERGQSKRNLKILFRQSLTFRVLRFHRSVFSS